MEIRAGLRLHFMGVGGIGVSALAALAAAQGAEVSGCDREEGERVRWLRGRGVAVAIGHDAGHVRDGAADWLVYSSAVPAGHPERVAAGGRQIRRGTMLAECMAGYRTVGVAGAHGKTTTTALLAQLAVAGGIDPTVMVGGVVPALGGNLRLGRAAKDGGVFIAELDESDGSFLEPLLDCAVVPCVEPDHLAHYGTAAAFYGAFEKFVDGLAPGALLLVGHDDPGARRLAGVAGEKRVARCGLSAGADWRAIDRAPTADGQTFALVVDGAVEPEPYFLPLSGEHNLRNALLALAAAEELGVGRPVARAALAEIRGPGRRMERVATLDGVPVYADYAHHPTEVRAALAGLRERERGPLLVVFQPHLYSRTRDCAGEFGRALAAAERVAVVELYPAREEPLPGVDSGLIVEAVSRAGGEVDREVLPLSRVEATVRGRAAAFGAVVLMGAGDIGKVADALQGAD